MSMLREKVSIVIPTYNRWHLLQETLKNTLTHNHANIQVVVLDNDSNQDGVSSVKEVIDDFGRGCCKIVKNMANLGGDGNILRCFEMCDTPYVLVLGDDDFLTPDYLAQIEHYVSQPKTWGWINFQCAAGRPLNRTEDAVFSNPYDMIAESNNWAELLFISTTLFNRSLVLRGMSDAQRFQITCSAHLVGLISGWESFIKSDNAAAQAMHFVLSARKIIESGGHGRDPRSFELIRIYQGMSSAKYFLADRQKFKTIRAAIRGGTRYVFKPRVLAKEFFYYTQKFGFSQSRSVLEGVLDGLRYMIGTRFIFYRWYLPVVVLFAACLRCLKSK